MIDSWKTVAAMAVIGATLAFGISALSSGVQHTPPRLQVCNADKVCTVLNEQWLTTT